MNQPCGNGPCSVSKKKKKNKKEKDTSAKGFQQFIS